MIVQKFNSENQLLRFIEMELKSNKKKFIRFFLGLSDEKEKQKVFHSKESDEMLKEQWENHRNLKDSGVSFDREGVFKRIQNQISEDTSKNKEVKLYTFIRKYAAILVIGLLATSTVVYFGIIRSGNNDFATLVYKNQTNEKVEIILPDGSKLILNTKSTVSYLKDFSKKRSIFLSGEAFLDVIKDTNRVFTVETSNVDIEVLGTTFNVMAYPGDEYVETTLVTGKVKINRYNPKTQKNQSVILTPNHKATFFIEDERFVMDKVDVNISTSWKQGILIIDNESFESVAKKLERKFDVKIKLSDDLLNKYRYSMTIENETIEEVLEIIKKTSPVDYTKVNGEIVFYSTK